jgi:toxin YoeB
MYRIVFKDKAVLDFQKFKKSGQKQLLSNIEFLVKDSMENPRMGKGKPEQLKYMKEEVWSRKINKQHRMVYQIVDDTIFVLSFRGHYSDK